MIKKLHRLENRYDSIMKAMKFLRKIKLSTSNILQEVGATFRSWGLNDNRFIELKNFKDIHKEKRCFIIATGPSLTVEDINKLENEITFSMNSICLNNDLEHWKPTYYGIQDFNVYEKVEQKLKELKGYKVFISHRIAKRYDINPNWIKYPLNTDYHSYDLRYKNKYHVKFSDNSYKVVYDGYTITYSLIQLAIYMGFTEIYLLGADNNYVSNKDNHFVEHGVVDLTFASAGERMNVAYEEVKKFTTKNKINIYNATRGGKLEVFPRVDLDYVLKGDN